MPNKDQADNALLEGNLEEDAIEPDGNKAPDTEAQEVVKIDGVDYSVDKATAKALREREKSFQRKLTEQAEDLKIRYSRPEPVPQANRHVADPDNVDGLDVMLFENPKEALKRLKAQIVNDVTRAYQADQGERQFWTDFYAENADLTKYAKFVKAVFEEHFNEWVNLPIAKARKELAAVVREEIAELTKLQHREDGDEEPKAPRRSAYVEGSGRFASAPKPTPKPEDKEPRTMVDILRERREARSPKPRSAQK